MTRRFGFLFALVLALVVSACSDDPIEPADNAAGTNPPTDATGGTTGGTTGGPAGTDGEGLPADCVTRLQVTGDDPDAPAGPFQAQLVVTGGGPTPGATPDELELAIYGGYPGTPSIPTGDPGAPDEGRVLVVDMTSAEGDVAADQTYSDAGDGAGEATVTLWEGDTQVSSASASVTITAITDSRVCGRITPGSSGVGVNGTFKAQRLEGPEF
jgi:hypothetical protein